MTAERDPASFELVTDDEVTRAGTGNAYPEHAMTAADAAPLIVKEVG